MITQRLIQADAKQCHSCSAELYTSDNFCRSCGISQTTGAIAPEDDCETTVLKNGNEIETYQSPSSPLVSTLTQSETYQSLSSPLVNTLTQNVATRTSMLRSNRFGMSIVAVLIAIPIWLLIILLSPLDAYTAIKTVSSQMNCE